MNCWSKHQDKKTISSVIKYHILLSSPSSKQRLPGFKVKWRTQWAAVRTAFLSWSKCVFHGYYPHFDDNLVQQTQKKWLGQIKRDLTRSDAIQTKSSIGCPRWFCSPEFLEHLKGNCEGLNHEEPEYWASMWPFPKLSWKAPSHPDSHPIDISYPTNGRGVGDVFKPKDPKSKIFSHPSFSA